MPQEDYIISVFCLIDDLYHAKFKSYSLRKAGFAPLLLDSEIITMLIVGELLGLSDNKKIWLKFKSSYCYLFPSLNMVSYKVFNKQATNLWDIMHILQKELLEHMGSWNLFIADGFPLPICHYARAKSSKLFKQNVSYGYCAAKQERYYGFKVLLVTTKSGIPFDYVIDAANIDERDLLLQANLPDNSTVIGDKGFIGKDFASNLLQHSHAHILTQTRSNMLNQTPKYMNKLIGKVRKRIETTISQLVEIFTISTTKARSCHGLIGRINRKILAFTTALYFNYQIVKDQFTKLELLIQA